MKKQLKNQQGVTLIELMVALTLGLILSAGAIMMFVGNKKTFTFQEEFSRLQENGRLAMTILMRDIRNAGYMGCRPQRFFDARENPGSSPLDNLNYLVYGFEGVADDIWKSSNGTVSTIDRAGTPADMAAIIGIEDPDYPKNGTDILSVRALGGCGGYIYKHPGKKGEPGSANLHISGDLGNGSSGCAKECTTAIATNCEVAALFYMTQVNGNASADTTIMVHNTGSSCSNGNKNYTNGLSTTFEGGQLIIPGTNVYFIGPSSFTPGSYSLYRSFGGSTPEELIEGISDLQVEFFDEGSGTEGVYLKADSVDLTSAGNIAEWERVIKVKIHLLADSLSSGVLESSQTKTYYDGNLSVTDARLHKEFRNQVVIRNKVL